MNCERIIKQLFQFPSLRLLLGVVELSDGSSRDINAPESHCEWQQHTTVRKYYDYYYSIIIAITIVYTLYCTMIVHIMCIS